MDHASNKGRHPVRRAKKTWGRWNARDRGATRVRHVCDRGAPTAATSMFEIDDVAMHAGATRMQQISQVEIEPHGTVCHVALSHTCHKYHTKLGTRRAAVGKRTAPANNGRRDLALDFASGKVRVPMRRPPPSPPPRAMAPVRARDGAAAARLRVGGGARVREGPANWSRPRSPPRRAATRARAFALARAFARPRPRARGHAAGRRRSRAIALPRSDPVESPPIPRAARRRTSRAAHSFL